MDIETLRIAMAIAVDLGECIGRVYKRVTWYRPAFGGDIDHLAMGGTQLLCVGAGSQVGPFKYYPFCQK